MISHPYRMERTTDVQYMSTITDQTDSINNIIHEIKILTKPVSAAADMIPG